VKYVIVCVGGMADVPHAALDGRTVMEAARTPSLDRLTSLGAVGRAQASWVDLPCGSPVANLAILGYDPRRYHPNGRSSFEALAAGTRLRPGDLAFRCNLVSISAEERMADFTAGQIATDLAGDIIWNYELDDAKLELYVGQQYRHCLIVRDAHVPPEELVLAAPHCHREEEILPLLPRGHTPRAAALAARLRDFMSASRDYLESFNRHTPTAATMCWLWSASSSPLLPPFEAAFGRRAALVCGLDFLKGIAIAAGIETKNIAGATGYIDTNLRAKLRFTINYLRNYDVLYLHVNALDEASHMRNPLLKAQLLEKLDAELLGPLLAYLERTHARDWRVMVIPDHYALSTDGAHHPRPVPLVVAGAGIRPDESRRMTERTAEGRPVVAGMRLMAPFLDHAEIIWDEGFAADVNLGEPLDEAPSPTPTPTPAPRPFLDRVQVAAFWDQARRRADSHQQTGYLQDEWPAELGQRRFEGEWRTVSRWLDEFHVANGACLDVGCGVGIWLELLAGRFTDAHGIDLSREMVTSAAARAKRLGLDNVRVERRSVTDLTGEATYDLIFVGGVFTYLNDDEIDGMAARLAALLRPGGLLILRESTTTGETWYRDTPLSPGLFARPGERRPPYHAIYRNPGAYRDLVRHRGFELLRCRPNRDYKMADLAEGWLRAANRLTRGRLARRPASAERAARALYRLRHLTLLPQYHVLRAFAGRAWKVDNWWYVCRRRVGLRLEESHRGHHPAE
jgi:2,3-bisphosphoglycerate-independent phosphoglycerate mutase